MRSDHRNRTNTYSFRKKIDIEGLDHPKRMFDLTEGLIRRIDPAMGGLEIAMYNKEIDPC